MAFTLQRTESTWLLSDDSGFRYTITTTMVPEEGWCATAVLTARGMISEEAAIERVRDAALRFINMVKMAGDMHNP